MCIRDSFYERRKGDIHAQAAAAGLPPWEYFEGLMERALNEAQPDYELPPGSNLVVVRDITIDIAARRAWLGENELALTLKEFDLLLILMKNPGKVLTRECIMMKVWGLSWWGSTKTLDMHISWLRKKLGDDAANPRYIATVRGVGFRFEKS